MLQEIVKNYKKESWLRLCTLHGIDKWNLIEYLNEPVYRSRYLIKTGLEIATRNCLNCGLPLKIGIYKGTFIATTNCDCAKDHTNLITKEKLLTVFSLEQADLALKLVYTERKKGLPNTLDYWINKGLSPHEAEGQIKLIQKERSLKSPSSKKGARGYSVRTKEYWIKMGFDEKEAIEKVKEIQTTNGLEFYINKYGTCGEEMFRLRIEKWLNSEGNKKMIRNRSKKSLELFEQIGIGSYGIDEKTVRGKSKVHRVDFIYEKKIIEFYGDYWHGNPKTYSIDSYIRKKKIVDVWGHDLLKIQDLEAKGYSVMIVWEMDYKNASKDILQKCMDFIYEG
jgi:G:T-mismatch repair DNA endonuclease (very short patch repair protein)